MLSSLLAHLRFRPPDLRPSRSSALALGVAAACLALATGLTALVQTLFSIGDASMLYLLPVVAVGTFFGGWAAVTTAFAAFLAFDFFFVRPLYTFSVASAEAWLDLLLFLVVAMVIGRLSALQLARAREAEFRTAEARAMFALSRDVATAASALEAAPGLAARLARTAEMARVWIALGTDLREERTIADTEPLTPRPLPATRWVLHATSAEMQPEWARIRDTAAGRHREHEDVFVFRVPIVVGGETIGSIWATRQRTAPFPGRSHSRLMAAAADQLGQAVFRDRLAAEATAAEIARQGDALKSALLDSVSHDLRTPLAAIRATAGNLMDPEVDWTAEARRSAAAAIDAEADRLSRLVHNLLDMGRIQGGALEPSLGLYDLADLVGPAVERHARLVAPSKVRLEVPESLPPVRADAIFVEQILANLLENISRYAGGRDIVIGGRAAGPMVELTVEDGGPGVAAEALPRLFDRFYRGPNGRAGRADSSNGMGLGLAVVRGLTEAMGGSVEARRSALGGLAVVVRLVAAREAPRGEDSAGPALEPEDVGPGTVARDTVQR